MSSVEKLWRYYPRRYSDCPKVEQRAIDQALREWNQFGYMDNDGAKEAEYVVPRVAELVRQSPPQPQTGRAPQREAGRVVQRYTDGSVLIELDEGVVEEDRRRVDAATYDTERYENDFRPYGATEGVTRGQKIQGPTMAEHVDPSRRFSGDPRQWPNYNRDRDRLRTNVRQGKHGVMPDADISNQTGTNGMKFVKRGDNHPTLESGAPMYGDPKTFGSRDPWKSRFTGGYSAGPAGRTHKE